MAFLCFPDYFNPRSSCEERQMIHDPVFESYIFQSTLLMRGATWIAEDTLQQHIDISIHAPHARSDWKHSNKPNTKGNFNPRSSCEERPAVLIYAADQKRFQSTLLMRGATARILQQLSAAHDFNPRSSCEERQLTKMQLGSGQVFQSTLLMRGATCLVQPSLDITHNFNPRSSCEERPDFSSAPVDCEVFQSTLLMRGATHCMILRA